MAEIRAASIGIIARYVAATTPRVVAAMVSRTLGGTRAAVNMACAKKFKGWMKSNAPASTNGMISCAPPTAMTGSTVQATACATPTMADLAFACRDGLLAMENTQARHVLNGIPLWWQLAGSSMKRALPWRRRRERILFGRS